MPRRLAFHCILHPTSGRGAPAYKSVIRSEKGEAAGGLLPGAVEGGAEPRGARPAVAPRAATRWRRRAAAVAACAVLCRRAGLSGPQPAVSQSNKSIWKLSGLHFHYMWIESSLLPLLNGQSCYPAVPGTRQRRENKEPALASSCITCAPKLRCGMLSPSAFSLFPLVSNLSLFLKAPTPSAYQGLLCKRSALPPELSKRLLLSAP